jgi:hypothetical protein
MTLPTVTELPMTLVATEHDPFVDALDAATTVAGAESQGGNALKATLPGLSSARTPDAERQSDWR